MHFILILPIVYVIEDLKIRSPRKCYLVLDTIPLLEIK